MAIDREGDKVKVSLKQCKKETRKTKAHPSFRNNVRVHAITMVGRSVVKVPEKGEEIMLSCVNNEDGVCLYNYNTALRTSRSDSALSKIKVENFGCKPFYAPIQHY